MLPTELPIGLYTRISEDPYKLRAGVTRQRADCTQLATSRWPAHPHQVYEDNDLSSSRYARKPRPAFEELCRGIERGELYAVVGWDFDRLFRNPRELESFLDLCDRLKFTRALTAQGDVDLTTNDGRLHARIMVAVAAKESDDKSRRIRRVIQDKRERGLHDGKTVVYGYHLADGLPILDPKKANTVLHAANSVLSGESLANIARSMPPGAPQTPQGVRSMLLSPTLAGLNSARVRGTWTPILSDQQHADLRALLLDPQRGANAPRGRRSWWLSGLVWCECGQRLKVRRDKKAANYVCYKGCNRVGIRARKLQVHMELALFAVVKAMEPVTGNDGIEEVFRDESTSERLSELAVLYATGTITRAEWTAARDSTLGQQLIHEPAPSTVLRPVLDLPSRWDAWSPVEQHHQAARVIHRVVVHRSQLRGVWEPDRVKVTWRSSPLSS